MLGLKRLGCFHGPCIFFDYTYYMPNAKLMAHKLNCVFLQMNVNTFIFNLRLLKVYNVLNVLSEV